MLLIEIALMIAAWKKGWGARALLPMAGGLGLAGLAGFSVGLSGGHSASLSPIYFLMDIGVIGILTWMVRRRPAQTGSRTVPGPAEVPSESVQRVPDA